MGDVGEVFRALKETRRELRAEHGVNCPQCRIARPKAHPSILLPQQRCRVDGYIDPRPRLTESEDEEEVVNKPIVLNVRRSELSEFVFANCATCSDTIVFGLVRATQKHIPLDPQPTHGTELDRGYARHFCKAGSENEE